MSRHRDVRGQALVEFALVAPIFFLISFAIIEFGRFIYYNEILNDATREGARYAIVHGSSSLCPSGPMPGGASNPCGDVSGSKVTDTVKNYAIGVIRDGSFQVQACWFPPSTTAPDWCDPSAPRGDNGRGSYVLVTMDYTYNTLLPIVPLPPITLHGESTLVINH